MVGGLSWLGAVGNVTLRAAFWPLWAQCFIGERLKKWGSQVQVVSPRRDKLKRPDSFEVSTIKTHDRSFSLFEEQQHDR